MNLQSRGLIRSDDSFGASKVYQCVQVTDYFPIPNHIVLLTLYWNYPHSAGRKPQSLVWQHVTPCSFPPTPVHPDQWKTCLTRLPPDAKLGIGCAEGTDADMQTHSRYFQAQLDCLPVCRYHGPQPHSSGITDCGFTSMVEVKVIEG